MKKYFCGFAAAAILLAPASAEEVYVHNRAFHDTTKLAGTTYVPVTGFLKATDVNWSQNGSSITLGIGSNPDITAENSNVTFVLGDERLDLSGISRGGRLYVPLKDLAKFMGYSVNYSSDTGIIDVVKAREITSADQAAAKSIAEGEQAAKEALKAERTARQAKEKALAEAKAAAADQADEDKEAGDVTNDGKTESAASEAATETKPKNDKAATNKTADTKSTENVESSKEAPPKKSEEPKVAPKANLIVLSQEADPNYYTGKCTFRAVIQNQGYAPAEGVTAQMLVTGPDGRELVSKTLYHGPIAVDGRWEITEVYNHPLKAAMPRGNFSVNVTPKFTSGVVAEKK